MAAKRCNFTNDAATIRIFIKGVKNAHRLATHIYEKGPQMLNNAISEVEKPNTVQHLTATISPPCTVSMMTSNDDRCFQCQEHGHIARHFANIRCFECNEDGHIVMDCPHKIPPSGTPAKDYQSKLHKGHHVRSSLRHHYEDREGKAIQGLSHILIDTTAQIVRIPIDVILDHNIRILAIITGVAHDTQILHTGVIAINFTVTLNIDHTTGHLHTGAHHTTPEIEVCHVYVHPTNPHGEPHIGQTCTPVDHKANHITRTSE